MYRTELLSCLLNAAVAGSTNLRELRVEMGHAVLAACDWSEVYRHDFYKVYLTASGTPSLPLERLKQLLELNHKIHTEEVAAGLWDKKTHKGKNHAGYGLLLYLNPFIKSWNHEFHDVFDFCRFNFDISNIPVFV